MSLTLDHALVAAEALRRILDEELRGARDEQRLLRQLDVEGLLARAARRAAFLTEIRGLEIELSRQLARARDALGAQDVTLDALRAVAPTEGARLAHLLDEARALAGALSRMDALNHALAARALSAVQGYVDALAPAPRAYDRRGTRPAASAPAVATMSSQG